MVKKIVTDPLFLSIRSELAEKTDIVCAADLLQTVIAHSDHCVGMAANMIGIRKRIIVFRDNQKWQLMYNPEILSGKDTYEAEEACLSLIGTRKAIRFNTITVRFRGPDWSEETKTYTGYTAQIIQHEIDHCNGILI